jgi:fibronectin-binding autotransporter adhesin
LTAPDIVVGFFNAGQLVVANGSTVTGSIEVGNGSVIIGGTVPDEAGTILGNIILNNGGASSLIFRTTNIATYAGNVSGAGSILIDGASVRLTGDNSGHSGTTTVQSGSLAVGALAPAKSF